MELPPELPPRCRRSHYTKRSRSILASPDAKFSGELEITAQLGLSALSGGALVISKCISNTPIFLEISLEISVECIEPRRPARELARRLGRCAQRISRAATPPRAETETGLAAREK